VADEVVAVVLAVAAASAAGSAVLPCAVVTVARPVVTHRGVADTVAATVVVAVALVAATNLIERTSVGRNDDYTIRYEANATILWHAKNGIVETEQLGRDGRICNTRMR